MIGWLCRSMDSKLKPTTISQVPPRLYSGSPHATLHSYLFGVAKITDFFRSLSCRDKCSPFLTSLNARYSRDVDTIINY